MQINLPQHEIEPQVARTQKDNFFALILEGNLTEHNGGSHILFAFQFTVINRTSNVCHFFSLIRIHLCSFEMERFYRKAKKKSEKLIFCIPNCECGKEHTLHTDEKTAQSIYLTIHVCGKSSSAMLSVT